MNTKNDESEVTHCAVDGGSNLTGDDIIDGFTIIGGGGRFSAGIYVLNTSPKITNCIISGGSVTRNYGLLMNSSPSVIIQNNITNGGKESGCDQTFGILMYASSPTGDSIGN